jgi:predicted N-formylglutamate amidohydrolase
MTHARLLEPDEPDPATRVNQAGGSVFVFACDHAGRTIPRQLKRLGLPEHETERHIAWDIGIGEVGRRISSLLDAALVLQTYSRLVIDCNRDPSLPSSIPEISDSTEIPGNRGIGAAARAARVEEIFRPYHNLLGATLDHRTEKGDSCVLVTLHSFTPILNGVPRPWHAGVLYNRDVRLARPLLRLLRAEGDLIVGDNEPYRLTDLTDYTVPVHAECHALPYVEVEIRQDLITDPAGQSAWAERLARLLPAAYAEFLRA